jgi:hypothetical protein
VSQWLNDPQSPAVLSIWFDGIVNEMDRNNAVVDHAQVGQIGGVWLTIGSLDKKASAGAGRVVWLLTLAKDGAVGFGREVAGSFADNSCHDAVCLNWAVPKLELAPGKELALRARWNSTAGSLGVKEKVVPRAWRPATGAKGEVQGEADAPVELLGAAPADYARLPSLGAIDKEADLLELAGSMQLSVDVLGDLPAAVSSEELQWQVGPWTAQGPAVAVPWYAGMERKAVVAEMVQTAPVLGRCGMTSHVGRTLSAACVAGDLRPCWGAGLTSAAVMKTKPVESFCREQTAAMLGALFSKPILRTLSSAGNNPQLWVGPETPEAGTAGRAALGNRLVAEVEIVRQWPMGTDCPKRLDMGDTRSPKALQERLQRISSKCNSKAIQTLQNLASTDLAGLMAAKSTTFYEHGSGDGRVQTAKASKLYAVNTLLDLAHALADHRWPERLTAVRLVWEPHLRRSYRPTAGK